MIRSHGSFGAVNLKKPVLSRANATCCLGRDQPAPVVSVGLVTSIRLISDVLFRWIGTRVVSRANSMFYTVIRSWGTSVRRC